MKRIFHKSIFSFALLLSFANAFSQVSFGVKGAANMFNMTVKDNNDDKVSTGMVPTFSAGVYADIPLVPEFFIRPELLFTQKGYKNKDLDDAKTRISYVEIPVSFLYKAALTGGNVIIGFGPYAALGIGGKMKDGNSRDVKFKNDVSIQEASQNPYFKSLDFGAKIYAGYEFGTRLSLAIESSLGLVNILPQLNGNDNGNAKNVGFGIAIGYKIR